MMIVSLTPTPPGKDVDPLRLSDRRHHLNDDVEALRPFLDQSALDPEVGLQVEDEDDGVGGHHAQQAGPDHPGECHDHAGAVVLGPEIRGGAFNVPNPIF